MKCFVVIFFLLSQSVMSSTATINSLPYTANQTGTDYSDTLVLNGTNLSSATDGISVTGHDIVIDLTGDTLTFGTGDGNDNYGIRFYGDGTTGAYNIKIINGTILHSLTTDTTATGNNPIRFTGGSNIYIENTDLTTGGYAANVVYRPSSGYGIWNVEINGGDWTSEVTAYASRCSNAGAAAKLISNLTSVSAPDYNFKIHGVTVVTTPASGIVIGGLSEVYECTVTVDARNDLYPTSNGNTCQSSINAVGIQDDGLLAGAKIHDNIIRAGTSYRGCDLGLYLGDCVGTAANPILIYDNDILIHRGWDNNEGWLRAKGIKSRFGCKYVNIYNNIIVVQTGDSVGNTSYGGSGVGIEFYSYAVESYAPDSFVNYYNNDITAVSLDSGFSDAVCVKFAASYYHSDTTHKFFEAGNTFRNNTLTTSAGIFVFGAAAGNGGQSFHVLVDSNTLVFDATTFSNDKYMYEIGYNAESIGNWARDNTYSGETADSQAILTGYHFNGDTERDWVYEKTITVSITGNNDLPVVNAEVLLVNAYSDTIVTDTTNANGLASGIMRYLHTFADATGNDSTSYSPTTVYVEKTATTKDTTITLNWNTPTIELVLDVVGQDIIRRKLKGMH